MITGQLPTPDANELIPAQTHIFYLPDATVFHFNLNCYVMSIN